MSVGISIGGDLFSSFLSAIGLDFSVSSETSTETSNTTTYSTKYTMGPSPGTDGYATFQPKYICKFSLAPLFPLLSSPRGSVLLPQTPSFLHHNVPVTLTSKYLHVGSQGEFVGDDCDGTEDLGDWKCAASFTQVNGDSVQPEGVWRMVTVT